MESVRGTLQGGNDRDRNLKLGFFSHLRNRFNTSSTRKRQLGCRDAGMPTLYTLQKTNKTQFKAAKGELNAK